MSYNFGQFRKSQFSSYLTPLEYSVEDIQTVSSGTTFIDKAIQLSGDNILRGQDDGGNQCSYYLKVKIFRLSTKQTITIKIVNTSKIEDNVKVIKTVEVGSGQATGYLTFEMIISPNDNYTYNQILFELNRTQADLDITDGNNVYGREMNIEVMRLDKIYNIIDFLSPSIGQNKILKQIGVQGPSGLLMSINGEEIRVGRTGLYEINYGVNIAFIGFVVEADEKYFVLDYQY